MVMIVVIIMMIRILITIIIIIVIVQGLALTFCSGDEDSEVLKKVQERFEVNIGEMPDSIDTTSYLNA